jgi:hypothetical protein
LSFQYSLLGSGFQRRTFPFLWIPELFPASATNLSHQQLAMSFQYSLLGSGFQRRTFPFLWIPELFPASATNLSHQQLAMTVPQQVL